MWWLLNFLNWTAGKDPTHQAFELFVSEGYYPGSPAPKPSIIADWERVWNALVMAPSAGQVINALDKLIPKSQCVIARKAASLTPHPSSFGGPIWSHAHWKRRLRDGAIRLGGFDVRWTVRRRSTP